MSDGIVFTQEQLAVLAHDPSHNGRVLAGPGTGKSLTAVALMRRFREEHPDLRVRILTFTRAATAELGKELGKADIDFVRPATIHSFALSILMRNPKEAGLPLPLRIPDSWERKHLIHADLAVRLRRSGFGGVDTWAVERLEHEMSARWEALDDSIVLLADVDPRLRNAYIGMWQVHRRTHGYTLLAELPLRASDALEDFDLSPDDVDFLLVDEYQDLNESDIQLIRLLASRGARVLAIGDDDQSIYKFRMAAPEGIRRFPDEFGNCADYDLSVSHRCGDKILDAAVTLIETAPGRGSKKRLTCAADRPHNAYAYLRFTNELEEARGVADIVAARVGMGVPPSEIAVLVRARVDAWAKLLAPELEQRGIQIVDVDWVEQVLSEPKVRKWLAILRTAVEQDDSLAWWTLLRNESGIAGSFVDYVFESATSGESFGEALLRLRPDFSGAPSRVSADRASALVGRVQEEVKSLQPELGATPDGGWGAWIVEKIGRDGVSEEAAELLTTVGGAVESDSGLEQYLTQLEPMGKDLASKTDAVRLMTMTSSKGLTVDMCIVMGVEEGLIPHPRADDDEERRLLYVAITRARSFCVLTCAKRRHGQTAHQGARLVSQPRARSPLLRNLSLGRWSKGPKSVAKFVKWAESQAQT